MPRVWVDLLLRFIGNQKNWRIEKTAAKKMFSAAVSFILPALPRIPQGTAQLNLFSPDLQDSHSLPR